MATIGIWDADFFSGTEVLPNLECAKLSAYFKQKRDITVISPTLSPSRFTNFYVRKDRLDGNFPKELFLPNVTFGGLAFSKNIYIPMEESIEKMVPDFSGYERFSNNFGTTSSSKAFFKKIMRSASVRFSIDGKNISNWLKKEDYLDQYTPGIFIHDYELTKISGILEVIKDWSSSRETLKEEEPYPYPIGVKHPIQIYSEEQLFDWLKIPFISGHYIIQYNGVLSDEACAQLVSTPGAKRIIFLYKTDSCYSSENDFLKNYLLKIYTQCLYFRNNGLKFSLTFEDNFLFRQELENLIYFLNLFFYSTTTKYERKTLLGYCKRLKDQSKILGMSYDKNFRGKEINLLQVREFFQLIRETDYEIFSAFYEYNDIIYDNGRLINDTRGDSYTVGQELS